MSKLVDLIKKKLSMDFKLSLLFMERIKMRVASKKYSKKYPTGTIKFIDKFKNFDIKTLNTQKIILFVVYAPKSVLMYQRYFELLEKIGYSIIVISNGKLPEKFVDEFFNRTILMAERYNIGRDFGTYKEFISLLNDNSVIPKDLIICNDSVFANLNTKDERFITFIKENDDKDFLGVAEYFGQPGYHVQSYFLKLSDNVLQGKNFQDFWKNFQISDDRRSNIHNGEIKLSQSILKDGIKPTVFLGIERLIDSIVSNKLLLQKFIIEISGNRHIDPESIQLFKNLCLSYYDEKAHEEHINYYRATLRLEISRLIERFGFIVVCPFFIIETFGFPFLKRDIVYRQITDFALIRYYGETFDQDLLSEFIADQRTRVRSWNINNLKDKLMYHTGMN